MAPFLENFRLLASAKLPGAMMAAACLQCAVLTAVTVGSLDLDVIFLFVGMSVPVNFVNRSGRCVLKKKTHH